MATSRKFAEQRLKEINSYLQKHKSAEVEELVRIFNVSGTTIRADLRELESQNYITRTHGGAIVNDNRVIKNSLVDPGYLSRIKQNHEMKIKIGIAVAGMISDNESVILDDGSTTLQVAKSIHEDQKITVITNGVNICLELAKLNNVEVISTGGIFRKNDLSYNGKVAEETVSKFYANKAILGAMGVSLEYGITAPEEAKAELKKIMIENSSELIIVADHTKIERVSLRPVCSINRITTLVTDNQISESIVEKYKNAGVNIIVAD